MKEIEELTIKLSDEQDENVTLKKKHAANVKDLTRQLQILQKKLTSSNNNDTLTQQNIAKSDSYSRLNHFSASNDFNFAKPSQPPPLSNMNMRRDSRTSSTSSLNENEQSNSSKNNLEDDGRLSLESTPVSSSGMNISRYNEASIGTGANTSSHSDDVYIVDIDKQKLIEKIVKLQRDLAKRNEKIDFLQDHVNQLTNDLKRKTKFDTKCLLFSQLIYNILKINSLGFKNYPSLFHERRSWSVHKRGSRCN